MTSSDQRKKILIVDDAHTNIDLLRDILRKKYRLSVALSGEQALKLAFSDSPPDLILLDVIMPEMDGYKVCRQLKADERTRGIPVIFLTARNTTLDETLGLSLGAVDYITKPFNPGIIKLRVKNHLELKEHRDRLEELVRERTAELEAAKDAAQAGNRAKSEFLSIISHEFRTPLNAILGFAHFLANPDLDQERRVEFVSHVVESGKTLLELVNDILGLVRADAADHERQLQPFSLKSMVTEVVHGLGILAAEKELAFTSRVADDLPDALIGDHMRLRQILLHLLKNAIKFTREGSVSLEVERGPDGEGDAEPSFHFMVRDSGVGIPEEKQELIFQQFTQVEESGVRSQGGIGLGLTICKRYAALMDGRIWLESRVGKGSVFHLVVRLPELPGPGDDSGSEPGAGFDGDGIG